MAPARTAAPVITGRGMVTPLGAGVQRNFERMSRGDVALGPVNREGLGTPGQHFGVIEDAELAAAAGQRGLRRLDRAVTLAFTAVQEALTEARLLPTTNGPDTASSPRIDPDRLALCLGTSTGPADHAARTAGSHAQGGLQQLRRTNPLGAVQTSQAAIAGELARRFGISGPSLTVNAECATGNTVVGLGRMLLESGAADAVVCCAVDATITALYVDQANLVGALASGPCRPFDTRRDGFVMAEGAAAVVLEPTEDRSGPGRLNHQPPAQSTVLGVGMTTDLSHPTAPQQDGAPLRQAIKAALRQAGIGAEQIDVVSAHGTGTKLNDPAELAALRTVLGERFPEVPIHAVKSMIGHTLAAAGLIELIVLGCTLSTGIVPPTVRCKDPVRTTADIVRHHARRLERPPRVGLSTSCGFGGNNTAVLLSLPKSPAFADAGHSAGAITNREVS